MSNKALLEVDESIIKNNLLLTEKKEEDEEFTELLRTLEKPETPSVIVRPLPGTCVKCKTENGEKVFLNVCHTMEIPPPEDLSEEKFLEVIEQEQPTWCVPMSIGHERFEEDKGGQKCLTYDIALNTKFYEKCKEKMSFWTFTVLIIISAVSEKFERSIKTDYVVLKNRQVMGKLHDHRVQKREIKKPVVSKPLIEEITSTSTIKQVAMENKIKETELIADPRYVLLRKPKEGKIEELIGYFKLARWHRIKDIRVDVCDDRIIVEAPTTNYLVDIFVPWTLDQDKVTAVMDQNINILRVKIAVI